MYTPASHAFRLCATAGFRLRGGRAATLSTTAGEQHWVAVKHESGRTYWHNPLTDATTQLGAPEPVWVPVPQDGSGGVHYWWNTVTNATTPLGAPFPAAGAPVGAAAAATQLLVQTPAQPPAQPPAATATPSALNLADDDGGHWWRKLRASSLSGAEMYCLRRSGLAPNQYVFGADVRSMGLVKDVVSSLQSMVGGGAVDDLRAIVHDCRAGAMERMLNEVR